MTRRLLILTDRTKLPLSGKRHWQAFADPYKPGDVVGRGPTESDAVMDLYVQIAELEADDSDRFDYEVYGNDH